MIVGLTGGISTGKSTVSAMLRQMGAYVVDADVWARKVVEPGSEGLRQIVESFGERVVQDDGTLDRKALGSLIFEHADARQQLNAITHPRIRQGMQAETLAYQKEHETEPVIWDVPLLFEGDTHQLVDCTILVYATPDTQFRRLMARDGIDEVAARRRIDAQLPIEEKKALATFLIDNEGEIDTTREQVERVWTAIRKAAIDARDLSS